MEAERQAYVMKVERQTAAVELAFHISDWFQITFRFISDCWSGKIVKTSDFRLVQVESSDFKLGFQISYWLQIGFRFISEYSLEKS